LSTDVNGLLVGRAITGLAAGTWVPLVALFSSLFPADQTVKSTAMLTLVGSVGRMLATGVTGSLNVAAGYSLAFFLAAGAAVLAALIVLPVREVRRPSRKVSAVSIWHLFTRRDVLIPTLLGTVSQYANWAATFGFVPILASQLGASGVTLSLLLSLNVGLITAGNLAATTLVNRLGPRRLVYLSLSLTAGGIAVAAGAPTLAVLFAGQLCIGLGQGMGSPTLMGLSIRHVDETQRTTAMGLHQAIYATGMFGGPALSGVIADAIGIRPMLGVTAGVAIVLGVLLTRLLKDSSGSKA